MSWSSVLADLLVVVHAGYVAFVVAGLAATLVGTALRWSWVRNFSFRIVHLAMMGIVLAEAVAGIPCPLTVWEKQLRLRAGQASYPGDFLGHWAHRFVFFRAEPWFITIMHTLFGLAVVATFVLVPPRWPWRQPRDEATHPGREAG